MQEHAAALDCHIVVERARLDEAEKINKFKSENKAYSESIGDNKKKTAVAAMAEKNVEDVKKKMVEKAKAECGN